MHRPQYVWNDGVTATASSATGTYVIDRQAFDDVEDLSGNRYQCTYTSYDGQGFATGQSGSLTRGLATTGDRYTSCGSAGNGFTPSGQIRTTHTYDAFGNQLTSSDPDANAGNSAHVGCSVGSTSYSTCTTYDGTFDVLPTATTNALNQTSTTGYATGGGASLTAGPITPGIGGKCVDDAGNGSADGTKVQLWGAGPVSSSAAVTHPTSSMNCNGAISVLVSRLHANRAAPRRMAQRIATPSAGRPTSINPTIASDCCVS